MPDATWDAATGRYRINGRFVSRIQVRQTFEQSLANLTQFTDSLTDQLRSGAITPQEFETEMRLVIKQTIMAAHELSVGGREQMTQADYGRVGQEVRTQYEFLNNWVQQVEAGTAGPHSGRANQYLRSARSYFLKQEAQSMGNRGYLARSVLRPAEHCAECIAESDKGLVPVQFLVPIGQRVCRNNCKCYFHFVRAA